MKEGIHSVVFVLYDNLVENISKEISEMGNYIDLYVVTHDNIRK
jgi:hypothetical protein